jgi:hypothetical protein
MLAHAVAPYAVILVRTPAHLQHNKYLIEKTTTASCMGLCFANTSISADATRWQLPYSNFLCAFAFFLCLG